MNDKIYPSMVIRNQAEAIELLEKENKQLKEKIKGIQEERDYLFNKLSTENKWLSKENKQLKHILDELEKDLKENIEDGRSKENVWLMGCYDEDKRILDKTKKLRGIENENKM